MNAVLLAPALDVAMRAAAPLLALVIVAVLIRAATRRLRRARRGAYRSIVALRPLAPLGAAEERRP